MLNYTTAPNDLGGSFRRYFEYGIPPGDFLCAVLNNDLKEACARADDINRYKLFDIVKWLYNEAPIGSWGSEGAVDIWCNKVSRERAKAGDIRQPPWEPEGSVSAD